MDGGKRKNAGDLVVKSIPGCEKGENFPDEIEKGEKKTPQPKRKELPTETTTNSTPRPATYQDRRQIFVAVFFFVCANLQPALKREFLEQWY